MAGWRRVWIIIGIGLVLAVVVLSLIPRPPETGFEHGDKLHHLVAYFVIMHWFAQLHAGGAGRTALAAGFAVMGVALEWLQGLTGYRDASALDALANAAGIALGWLAAPPRLPNLLAWVESRERR
jgi:VanZ family protein